MLRFPSASNCFTRVRFALVRVYKSVLPDAANAAYVLYTDTVFFCYTQTKSDGFSSKLSSYSLLYHPSQSTKLLNSSSHIPLSESYTTWKTKETR